MDTNLLAQTIISGALVSLVILGFLCRFAPRRARWPQVFAAAVFLDHASKWLVVELVKGRPPQQYLAGAIQINYCANFLQGFGAASPWLLGVTAVGAVGCIRLWQMLAERRYSMSALVETGLALVMGGVAAIAVERAWSGFVIDFIQFGPHSPYVCNLADLEVLVGVALLFGRGVAVLPLLIRQEMASAGAGR